MAWLGLQEGMSLDGGRRVGKCTIHGVDNVGTVPAAVTAYLAAQEFHPDLVISAGTAGGFQSKGAAIGDVFLATGFANHDRRIPIPVRCSLFAFLAIECGKRLSFPCHLIEGWRRTQP